jgi:hypothetical protein
MNCCCHHRSPRDNHTETEPLISFSHLPSEGVDDGLGRLRAEGYTQNRGLASGPPALNAGHSEIQQRIIAGSIPPLNPGAVSV